MCFIRARIRGLTSSDAVFTNNQAIRNRCEGGGKKNQALNKSLEWHEKGKCWLAARELLLFFGFFYLPKENTVGHCNAAS